MSDQSNAAPPPASIIVPASAAPPPPAPPPPTPSAFDMAFTVIVGEEGNFADDPRDPGGATRWGISQRAHPDVDVRNLTLAGARAIYKSQYWDELRCDELPPPLALMAFDAAVNCRPERAARWLQAAVGTAQDGVIGPKTLAAVAAHQGRGVAVLAEMHAQRIAFQMRLPTAATFGLGWARRLAMLPFYAVRMGL